LLLAKNPEYSANAGGKFMQPVSGSALLSPWTPGIFSLSLYTIIVLVIIAALLFICSWLGEKKQTPEKQRPYECGIIPTGTARLKYPIPFYLIAIFFLIFDVEAAFIFSWAVACENLGWAGWLQMSYFIFVLLIGLVYIWKKGGLDWGPESSEK
jgi:NADH-quinone oxidoreductase subunit A